MSAAQILLWVGLVLLALGVWLLRRHRPDWYWFTLGAAISLIRIRITFRSVMEACGLVERPSRFRIMIARATDRQPSPMVPRLRGVKVTRTGVVLRLKMQPGQEVHDFLVVSERLRHSWRAHGVHVAALKPGWLQIRLIAYDVLRRVTMPDTGPSMFLCVPVVLRSDGRPHFRDFRAVPHELVIGATDSGKSVYLRGLIKGLAPQRVALVGIDCKWGVELSPFARRLSALACTPQEAAEVLDALVDVMTDRFELICASQHLPPGTAPEQIASDIWGLPDDIRPVPIVLLVDEVAELFLVSSAADEKRRDHMVTQLIRLGQLGRAAGIYLEVCGQRFGSDLGRGATALRAQLTGRIVHRVNDTSTAKMALEDISPGAVIAATRIAVDARGTAIVGDLSGGWATVRAPLTALSETVATCIECAHLTPDIPALALYRPELAQVPVFTPADVAGASQGNGAA
ncbi:FtsK/SpoIIIE domain-containing protein [Streptomyces sp. NPDC017056]|uniref:FtsK/SpoIIIE domain-containing protein n=1 Tax=Streptomyces sp. NPDC017056 TaxID=3364973 RepID=UPI003793D2F7